MKYKAKHDYIDYADLLKQLGYKSHQPRQYNLGSIFIDAVGKSQGRLADKIKKQLDSYFIKLKEKNNKDKNGKKQRHNKRRVVSGNATGTQG